MLKARSGATLRTMVYVVQGQKQSLLGLKDGQALGIIEINPEGKSEVVRQLEAEKKLPAPVEGDVSGGQTQEQVDCGVERIVGRYDSVFAGIGRAKTKPIHIFTKPGVTPVQQKQRPVALHYKDRLKELLEELAEEWWKDRWSLRMLPGG